MHLIFMTTNESLKSGLGSIILWANNNVVYVLAKKNVAFLIEGIICTRITHSNWMQASKLTRHWVGPIRTSYNLWPVKKMKLTDLWDEAKKVQTSRRKPIVHGTFACSALRRCFTWQNSSRDEFNPGTSFTTVSGHLAFGVSMIRGEICSFGTILSRSPAPGRNFIPGTKIHVNTWFFSVPRGHPNLSWKSRKLFGPGKLFVKLHLAYSVKLVFSHVVKGIKI